VLARRQHGHFSGPCRYRRDLATYPGAQAGHLQALPYLVLLQVGFA